MNKTKYEVVEKKQVELLQEEEKDFNCSYCEIYTADKWVCSLSNLYSKFSGSLASYAKLSCIPCNSKDQSICLRAQRALVREVIKERFND